MSDRDETLRGTTGGDVTGGNPAGDDLADAITGGGTGAGLVDQIPLGGAPSSDAGSSAGDTASQGRSDDDVTTGANLGGVGT